MKKLMAFLLVLLLGIRLCGCKDHQARNNDLFETKGIEHVTVNALAETKAYSFSGYKARTVVEHLASLKLSTNSNGDSEDLMGGVWQISIEYENGDSTTWYHIANTFLRSETGSVYKMDHAEAHHFETLLEELNH